MSKSLVFTDLHLHSHKDRVDRLQNCIDVLDWVFDLAAERQCQNIFFLGDLFHEQEKIDVLNYLRTFECFMKHMLERKLDLDVWLLVGNHDMYLKHSWGVNSVKPLTAIPRIHIIDKPTSMTISGRRIDWMPHSDNPVKSLNAMKKGDVGDILFGHMSVHGALLNIFYGTKSDVIVEYDNEMVPVDVGIFSDWKITMLGHYHAPQKLSDTVEYVGSPHQLTFGEAFQDKHVIILDLETLEKEYVVNTFSPRHYILTAKDVQDENYNLDGQFVRLAVDHLGSQAVIDIKKELVTKYKVLSFDTKTKDRKPDKDSVVITDAQAILLNIQQMLEKYMEERGVPDGLDRAMLLQKGQLCLEKTI